MPNLTCTMISGIDLACYGVSSAIERDSGKSFIGTGLIQSQFE